MRNVVLGTATVVILAGGVSDAALPSTSHTALPVIVTVAGSATPPGFRGDGGAAVRARLHYPEGVAFVGRGFVIADSGNKRVRQVANGRISTVAGNGTFAPAVPAEGVAARRSPISEPIGVVRGAGSGFYVVDGAGSRLRLVSGSGKIGTVAGNGLATFTGDGVPAVTSALNEPAGVARAKDGSLFLADSLNNRVRKISTDGTISTLAGTGSPGFSGDGGPARDAALRGPAGVAVAPDGSVIIADTGNNRIRRVRPNGAISTIAGFGRSGFGRGSFGGDGGLAIRARFDAPWGLAVDASGTVYIADTGNNRVRRVTRAGRVRTVVGSGQAGFSGDGGPPTSARLRSPQAVAVNSRGSCLLIADTLNNRVRQVQLGRVGCGT